MTTTWDAPSYTGVTPITSYNFRYKKSHLSEWDTISGITGTERTISGLSHSTQYHLEVQAVNSFGAGDWSKTRTVGTTSTSTPNHRPYFLPDNNYSITVAENTPAGQEIGDPIAARDPDGNTLIYGLEGTDAAAFEVVKNASKEAQVKTKDPLNHEEQAEYNLTIRVMDTHDSPAREDLTISVTDVQEPGSVTLAPTQPTVAEEVTATLSEEDERTSASWQWAWSDKPQRPLLDEHRRRHRAHLHAGGDRPGQVPPGHRLLRRHRHRPERLRHHVQGHRPYPGISQPIAGGHQQLPAKPAQLRGGHGQQRLPGHRHRRRLPLWSEPQLQPNRRRRQAPPDHQVEPQPRDQHHHHHRHRRRGLPGLPGDHRPGRDGRIWLEGGVRPQHPAGRGKPQPTGHLVQ